jgi:pimeloyl-ACP methyl ester carboxylesterase
LSKVILYIHGRGGNAEEAELYRKIFPNWTVKGFNYKSDTPWECRNEINCVVNALAEEYDEIVLVANSIGAYFSLNADLNGKITKAFFISPIVNMERLIADMMIWANVTESDLREKGTIQTDFGETLSWQYLSYVRNHPIDWKVPTEILYGGNDNLTSIATITEFALAHNAGLTVMENGEHWFHTEEQMDFLQKWITKKLS